MRILWRSRPRALACGWARSQSFPGCDRSLFLLDQEDAMASHEMSVIDWLGERPSVSIAKCAGAAVLALKTNPVTATAEVDWSQLAGDMEKQAEEMLDVSLAKAVVEAWRDLREVRACADPAKHPPDETIFLPLLDHRVEVSLKPYLDVRVGEWPATRIHFEVEFALDLQGVVATIRQAKVRSLEAGRCRVESEIKCEGRTVLDRKSKYFDAPGKYVFPEGVPIAKSASFVAGR
jgi:hypothetical protein